MSDRVTIDITDGIADVRLDRGDKMNAMDPPMFAALVEASEALAADNAVRAVVLSGNGPAFCAGLDFSGFQAMAGGGDRSDDADTGSIGRLEEGRITHRAQQAVWGFHELPVPVIAAVHGVAFGAGIQLAIGADIRYVHPDVRMAVLEIRWGLTPDMTATQLLPGLVGADHAKELIWTGREVNGAEAAAIGLATKVCDDPHAEAMALARVIAGKSPHAIRGAKLLVELAATGDVATGFAEERRVIGSLVGTPNQVESVHAYFEKRDPVYRDVD
ncbi:MAG: crotonase/enoyl-CoA hydratase family protein [Acidimicrobiia bacterium]|nr:crotonase/enoyl-CoA hydratase family protein [Acidimicrobiia bacterium]